jgi:alpha-1,3-glucosyltransferase
LYEDKVASFWCSISVIFKAKQIFETATLLKVCSGITLLASLPSCIHLMMQPTPRNFLLSLASTSLAFFMFSFHVHEKSILLPLLPITCLLLLSSPPSLAWVHIIAAFSMWPLIVRDELVVAYVALVFFMYVPLAFSLSSSWPSPIYAHLFKLSMVGMTAIHLLRIIMVPPERYPDLFDLIVTSYSFVHFFFGFIFINWVQFTGSAPMTTIATLMTFFTTSTNTTGSRAKLKKK